MQGITETYVVLILTIVILGVPAVSFARKRKIASTLFFVAIGIFILGFAIDSSGVGGQGSDGGIIWLILTGAIAVPMYVIGAVTWVVEESIAMKTTHLRVSTNVGVDEEEVIPKEADTAQEGEREGIDTTRGN